MASCSHRKHSRVLRLNPSRWRATTNRPTREGLRNRRASACRKSDETAGAGRHGPEGARRRHSRPVWRASARAMPLHEKTIDCTMQRCARWVCGGTTYAPKCCGTCRGPAPCGILMGSTRALGTRSPQEGGRGGAQEVLLPASASERELGFRRRSGAGCDPARKIRSRCARQRTWD